MARICFDYAFVLLPGWSSLLVVVLYRWMYVRTNDPRHVHAIGEQDAVHPQVLVRAYLRAGVPGVSESRGAHVATQHHARRCSWIVRVPPAHAHT